MTLVGVLLAFAGIPFYKAELAMCYIAPPPLQAVRAFSSEVGHIEVMSRHATISLFNAGDCSIFHSSDCVLYASRWPLCSRLDHGVPGAGQICASATKEECKMGCPEEIDIGNAED